jgi:hypothetical protein
MKLTKGQEQLTSVSMRKIIQTTIIATYTGKKKCSQNHGCKTGRKRPVKRDLCTNKCIIPSICSLDKQVLRILTGFSWTNRCAA